MSRSKTKYTLYKNDGDGPKPCAFFLSAEGCKNGDNCRFLHKTQAEINAMQTIASSAPTPVATIDNINNSVHDAGNGKRKKSNSTTEMEIDRNSEKKVRKTANNSKSSHTNGNDGFDNANNSNNPAIKIII